MISDRRRASLFLNSSILAFIIYEDYMRIGIVGLAGHVSDCMKGAAAWKGAKVVAVSDPEKEKTAKFVKKEELAEDADAVCRLAANARARDDRRRDRRR